MPKLENANQEKFCQNLARGMTCKDSYMNAYPESKPNSARTLAARLAKQDNVQKRLDELRSENAVMSGTSRKDILDMYTAIMTDKDESTINRIKAMELLTKMNGWNEPEEHNVNVTGGLDLLVNDISVKLSQYKADYKLKNPKETNEDPA